MHACICVKPTVAGVEQELLVVIYHHRTLCHWDKQTVTVATTTKVSLKCFDLNCVVVVQLQNNLNDGWLQLFWDSCGRMRTRASRAAPYWTECVSGLS